jgi:hypothetical protein
VVAVGGVRSVQMCRYRGFGQDACSYIMIIYWLLLAFPALMALSYPVGARRRRFSATQQIAFAAFVLLFFLVGMLRFETGGDWLTYIDIFDDIHNETLAFAITRIDPLFGALLWFSDQLGTGIYLPNGICCLLLVGGVVRLAQLTREPWLGITIAVPYLLIVVGMGYVRQGAAIGLMLMAVYSMQRGRSISTIAFLVAAVGFHATAALAAPLFGYALTQKRRALSVIILAVGAVLYVFAIAPRLNILDAGYLQAEYESEGAFVRLLMSFLPSLLLVLRWRKFRFPRPTRSFLFAVAICNFLAMAALAVSPSSTAVDRIGLYFSIIQIGVFGEIRNLIGWSAGSVPLLRVSCIGVAVAVQSVWLVLATHASLWVPYRSVLE